MATNIGIAEKTAGQMLEVVPLVMRAIRAEMRRHRSTGMSIVHFRTLAFLEQHPGTSLTELADNIGVTLPTMSKLVESLVGRSLARRRYDPDDRRRIVLGLTAQGSQVLNAGRTSTRLYLARMLSSLSPEEREDVARSMEILRTVFTTERGSPPVEK